MNNSSELKLNMTDYDKLIPVHPTRCKIYNKFYDLFYKYNESFAYNFEEIKLKKMALNIERGIFNYTLKKYNSNNQSTWNLAFEIYYLNRCVTIFSNLNVDSSIKNINLIKRLFENEFTEFELAFFTSKELYPEKYEYLSKKFNLDKKEDEQKEEIHDGIFQCRKCKSFKTSYYELQTRSSDEPMTCFITCHNCNNKWKR